MSKLIILDMYGTLVKQDLVNEIRPGFQEFWEHYCENNFFAISTDGLVQRVKDILNRVNSLDKFDAIYGEKHMRELGGKYLKDLETICKKFRVHPEEAVFIGDNRDGVDECSAFYANIKFVRIPQFRVFHPSLDELRDQKDYVTFESDQKEYRKSRSKKGKFTFKSLIGKI